MVYANDSLLNTSSALRCGVWTGIYLQSVVCGSTANLCWTISWRLFLGGGGGKVYQIEFLQEDSQKVHALKSLCP